MSPSLQASKSQIRVYEELFTVHRPYPASMKLSSGIGGLNMHRFVSRALIFCKPVALQASIGISDMQGVVGCNIHEYFSVVNYFY